MTSSSLAAEECHQASVLGVLVLVRRNIAGRPAKALSNAAVAAEKSSALSPLLVPQVTVGACRADFALFTSEVLGVSRVAQLASWTWLVMDPSSTG